jgi:hypothetical protein
MDEFKDWAEEKDVERLGGKHQPITKTLSGSAGKTDSKTTA